MIESMKSRRSAVLRWAAVASVGASALAGSALALAGPVAAAETLTYHYQTDVSGTTITCGSTQLTTVAGSVFDSVFHENADGRGEYHATETDTPHPVTLSDTDGNVYNLEGASWFEGTFTDPDGNNPVVLTSTDEFSITASDGGLLGRVSAVTHLSPNGNFFSIDFGDCTANTGS